jgi:hypothetical protein
VKSSSFPSDWGGDGSSRREEEEVDSSIRGNVFRLGFTDAEGELGLDTGLGIDRLFEYVWENTGPDYGLEEVDRLNRYLLSELKEEEVLRGKDVLEYVEEFIEEEGSPKYLDDW